MALQRVPPNLLVGQGATDFAYEHNFPIMPHDYLISAGARERWLKWKRDLENAERQLIEQRSEEMDIEYERRRRETLDNPHVTDELVDVSPTTSTISPPPPSESAATDFGDLPPQMKPLIASTADSPEPSPLIDMTDYVDKPTLTAKDLLNISAYVQSPLSQVMHQDGPGRPTSNNTNNQGEDQHEAEEVVFSGRGPGRHDGSDEADSFPKSSRTLQLPGEAPSPPLFLTNAQVDCRPSPSKTVTNIAKEAAPLTNSPPSLTPLSENVIRRPPTINSMEIYDDDPVEHIKLDKENVDVASTEQPKRDDMITDTVGAIAVDCYGNIAAGSSSGGIGMKHRGRTGPAALVGVGTAVVPVDNDDPDRTSVAVVTSGTGEHMATTMAAATAADRIYNSVKKKKGGLMEPCTEDEAIQSMIEAEFMSMTLFLFPISSQVRGMLTRIIYRSPWCSPLPLCRRNRYHGSQEDERGYLSLLRPQH
jgi:taspase (threonine aspartase 1)